MSRHVLSAACLLLLACSVAVTSLPSSVRRHDLAEDSAADDEPFATDVESGLDLVAEESEALETVWSTEQPPAQPSSTPRLRGAFRFSATPYPRDSRPHSEESTPKPFSRSRYSPPNRYRSRKVTTAAPVEPEYVDVIEEEKEIVKDEKERSLMLVLPFGTKNLSESKLQELYTKAPVTWLINTTTTETPTTKYQTERSSTTVVVTPTPLARWPVTTTTTSAPPVIRDNVKELLASIGLFPQAAAAAAATSTTPSPPPFVNYNSQAFSPDMKNLLASFGLLGTDSANEIPELSEAASVAVPTQRSPPAYAEIDPSSFSVFKKIPSSNSKKEVSPDMKDFLATFGIFDEKKEEPSTIRARSKQLHQKPSSVTPSPTDVPTLHPESMSREMQRVLHSLGLAPNMQPEDDVTGTVTERGVQVTPQARSINSASIFNPTDPVQNSLNNTDAKNLKKLLDTFKLFSNNTGLPEETEKELENATKNLSKHDFSKLFTAGDKNKAPLDTLATSGSSPDPLSFDELLYAINVSRNSINKRQEANASRGYPAKSKPSISFDFPSSSTTTTKTTSTTEDKAETTEEKDENKDKDLVKDLVKDNIESAALTAATSVASSTEDSSSKVPDSAISEGGTSASFADLESSFGGSPGGTVDESLPPAKPNGFYFMLDWNTFLNVGEDNKGVNLKFNPSFGNSKNFLPITVP